MKFYSPKGELIESLDKAITFYSNIYYVLIGKVSANLESDIDTIYAKGIYCDDNEFIKFVKWKVGDRKESLDSITTNRGRGISIDKIKHLLYELKDSNLKFEGNLDITDVKNIYDFILKFDEGILNLGTVYNLAIVSLVTKGQFPIYDKYADVGLKAATEEYKIRTEIIYKEMPDKSSVKSIMVKYDDYINRLSKKFGNCWKSRREIDQALWSYGHMFEIKSWKRLSS